MGQTLRKICEARILSTIIRYADANRYIDTKNQQFWDELNAIPLDNNNLDDYLYELSATHVLSYEEIGEDGFYPIIFMGLTDQTHDRLNKLLAQIESEHILIEKRLQDLLTFNPEKLFEDIKLAQLKLDEAKDAVGKHDLLQPLLNPISQIQDHFRGVSSVVTNYEEIYKNIIKPVQIEGASGIRATVWWAVISIIISTMISLIISNWSILTSYWVH